MIWQFQCSRLVSGNRITNHLSYYQADFDSSHLKTTATYLETIILQSHAVLLLPLLGEGKLLRLPTESAQDGSTFLSGASWTPENGAPSPICCAALSPPSADQREDREHREQPSSSSSRLQCHSNNDLV